MTLVVVKGENTTVDVKASMAELCMFVLVFLLMLEGVGHNS